MGSKSDEDHDLEFVYNDSDVYENEISELYTYTEEPEFQSNFEFFTELLSKSGFENWGTLCVDDKIHILQQIIEDSETSVREVRSKAISSLLYLLQGVFGECEDVGKQIENCRENCFLFYEHGIFAIVQELLMIEIKESSDLSMPDKPSGMLSISDCKDLRTLLSILYTMVETLRSSKTTDSEHQKKLRLDFLSDLEQSLSEKDSLVLVLFGMVSKFCSQNSSNFPMKKVLLLLWKLLLAILGGFQYLHDTKQSLRAKENLPLLKENPIEIIKNMVASAPPTSASDLLDLSGVSGKRRGKRSMMYDMEGDNSEADTEITKINNETPYEEEKVTSIDDDPVNDDVVKDSDESKKDTSSKDDDTGTNESSGKEGTTANQAAPMTPMPMTPLPTQTTNITKDVASVAIKLQKLQEKQKLEAELANLPPVKIISGLPWVPKAHEKDVQTFFNAVRQKFIGFTLPDDITTVAGLPRPTHDCIKAIQRHVYKSISDLQIERERQILKCPMTFGKNEVIPDTATERLYQALLPHLPQYMIALLKILLAAAPTSKAKNDSINILSDILPDEMPTSAIISLKLSIDVNRHREIIVKAISSILLLLLKHFKLGHVYQFEYMSQHLVFANCIPLILKFFNQNIVAYVSTKNTIPCLEFPHCVIGEKPELKAETFEGIDEGNLPCWRNLFSTINLLRILNKLVKWKHSRNMMLVVFKSAPILKRALKVRQAMFQLYVLKLIKVQTKYLGRAWRKSNMKTMSAIYQKVRHRMNDDWAFGNDVDARPWDFQQEECALRSFVERFNIRRYHTTGSNVIGNGLTSANAGMEDDFVPVDNNLQSLLQEEIQLPYDFQKSYSVWLEREVYQTVTDWDLLLEIPCI